MTDLSAFYHQAKTPADDSADGRSAQPVESTDSVAQKLWDDTRSKTSPDTLTRKYQEVNFGYAPLPSLYRVKSGDTLNSIARRALNSCTEVEANNERVENAWRQIARDNQIKTPKQLKPGTQLAIDGKLVSNGVEADRPKLIADMPLETYSRGGEQHRFDTAKRVIEALPTGMQDFLKAAGVKLQISADFCHEAPAAAMTTPRGYGNGETNLMSPASYSPITNTVHIRQTVENEKGQKFWIMPDDLAESVRHETGHALDKALGSFSRSQEFAEAYAKDTSQLNEAKRKQLAYYLTDSTAGQSESNEAVAKSETFAQVFSALFTSEKTVSDPKDPILRNNKAFLLDFPAVSRLVKARVDKLENSRAGVANPSEDFQQRFSPQDLPKKPE